MARIVDTSVLITLEERGWGLSALGASLAGDEEVAMAAVTLSELLAGVHTAKSAEQRLRREAFVNALLEGVPILPFDSRVAKTYGRLWAELTPRKHEMSGNKIHDLQIAATALTHGCGVLTENVRDFARVPGLAVSGPRWP